MRQNLRGSCLARVCRNTQGSLQLEHFSVVSFRAMTIYSLQTQRPLRSKQGYDLIAREDLPPWGSLRVPFVSHIIKNERPMHVLCNVYSGIDLAMHLWMLKMRSRPLVTPARTSNRLGVSGSSCHTWQDGGRTRVSSALALTSAGFV